MVKPLTEEHLLGYGYTNAIFHLHLMLLCMLIVLSLLEIPALQAAVDIFVMYLG